MEVIQSPDTHNDAESSLPLQHPGIDGAGDLARRTASKKPKAAKERIRVSRACDRCKAKKTRCTGHYPCPLCVRVGVQCAFNATYSRGRPPPIMSEPTSEESSRLLVSSAQGLTTPDLARQHGQSTEEPVGCRQDGQEQQNIQQHVTPRGSSTSPHTGDSLETESAETLELLGGVSLPGQSSRNSPEPSQTDLQGHYVGPSSGMSFLLRLQKKLRQNVPISANSSIFTFGDAPLPEFDASVFVLPPIKETRLLVARYFDFAVPTHRFLHRPTVERWLEDFYENLGATPKKDGARERVALLFMVLAQATEYATPTGRATDFDSSARYFMAAEQQLVAERGEIRLTSVQARLCQCFYLLSQSRINHCWSLFGTTSHLVLAIGIHRKIRPEAFNRIDQIDFECRKRVFWAAYSLDNYLSAALGRPRTFHDEDIDQDFPAVVNDSDLTSQGILSSSSKSQSVMLAPVAHAMLSQIISHILRDLYSIRLPPLSSRISLAAKYSADLRSWRRNLPRFLDADAMDASFLIPLFQRQRNVLNLSYHHALILVHRPFLLRNFAGLSNSRGLQPPSEGETAVTENVVECLKAAMSVVEIVDELVQGKQIFRAFWFTHYFAFSAIVVLYVYTIQQRYSPPEKYIAYFNAAAKCQSQISTTAQSGSLAQRYGLVLEELRLEAHKEIQKGQREPFIASSASRGQNASFPPVWQQDHQNLHAAPLSESNNMDFAHTVVPPLETENLDTSPKSLTADLTGWGEFDHLVSMAGMGGLEGVFMGDINSSWNVDMNFAGELQ